jgi:hypothetical protein
MELGPSFGQNQVYLFSKSCTHLIQRLNTTIVSLSSKQLGAKMHFQRRTRPSSPATLDLGVSPDP